MKITAHSILSSTIGLGLAAYTVACVFIQGAAAPATAFGIACLAVYGLCEIALLEKAPPPLPKRRNAHRMPTIKAHPRSKKVLRVRAIVEYPRCVSARRAA